MIRKIVEFSATKVLTTLLLAMMLVACGGKTADEHIAAAKAFAEQGNNQAAIVELKNAIQQEPRLASARFELGKIYLQVKDYESAEKELSRALELGFAPEKVIPLISQAYQRTGANVALADLDIDNTGLTSAERLEVGYRKVQSLLQLDKTEEANELIKSLLELESVTVYKGLIEGVQLTLEEDLEGALALAVSLKERAPLNRDVLNFAARMFMLNGQQDEAIKVYEDYIRVADDDIEVKFILTNMLIENGEMAKAEQYVDQLLKINDQNGHLNQLKGITRASAGDYEAALMFSERAIQNGRNEPTVRLIAGYAAYELGEYEKAVGHLSFIAEFLPDNHPGLRLLAASQLQSNMGDQTNEVLERIDDISADDAGLFSRAGYELLRAGDEEAARQVIEQAEKISETADDLTRLGILKLSLNDIEGMINLEQAVEKAPESVTAKSTLASAYIATQQYDKAMELAKQWQQVDPASAAGYILQADVEQRQKNFAEAEATLAKAEAISPKDEGLMGAKVRLALVQNKNDEALDLANQLVAEYPDNIVGLAAIFAIKSSQGNATEALDLVKQRLQANPDNVQVRLLLARGSMVNNFVDQALQALNEIKPDKAAPALFWPLKGAALLRSDKVNEAEAHYNQWAKLYPQQENAVLGQLLVLDGKREYAKGLEIAEDFLKREDNLQISFIRAYLLAMTNNLVQAKQAMANIDSQYKSLPFLRGVQARIALLENRPLDAIEDATVAYNSNPNISNLLVLLRAYDSSGKRDQSYDLLVSHVENDANDARVLMLLAERQIGIDVEAAMQTYERVLEVTPNNFVVLNNLAYLLADRGELDRAESLAKQAYDIQPDNVATADTYAQILFKQNRIKESVDIYNRAITDSVKNQEILLNYIEVLLRNGDIAIAKRRIEQNDFSFPLLKERLDELKQTYNL